MNKYTKSLNKQEFKHIYDSHIKEIRNYIYYRSGNEIIADDITQETFIKVWEKQFKYEPEKTKSLLYKIANSLFLDFIRKEKYEADYIEDFRFKIIESYKDENYNDIYKQRCETALKVLTEKERTVFLMNRMEGIKYKEIADCLDLSVKAVEKRMSTALKKIKYEVNGK